MVEIILNRLQIMMDHHDRFTGHFTGELADLAVGKVRHAHLIQRCHRFSLWPCSVVSASPPGRIDPS